MSEHYLYEEVDTPLDNHGWPTYGYRESKPTSIKVECRTCGTTGYSPSSSRGPTEHGRHWLDQHLEHVRCACGKVTTKKGLIQHIGGAERKARREAE